MHSTMKFFSERNPVTIGIIGVGLTLAAVLAATNYQKLPLVYQGREYSAYFAEAGGLTSGAAVQVSGFKVGQVEDITLDGDKVLITFNVDKTVPIGDRTEASIRGSESGPRQVSTTLQRGSDRNRVRIGCAMVRQRV